MLPGLRRLVKGNTSLALGFTFLSAGLVIYLFDRELYWLVLGLAFTAVGLALQLKKRG